MVEYVTKTPLLREYTGPLKGVIDPQTGLPLAQPGSVEFEANYRPEMDPRLSDDERTARAEASAAAQQGELDAAVAALNETHHPPPGWVIVRGPAGASASCGADVGNDHRLVRQGDVDALRAHGWVPA